MIKEEKTMRDKKKKGYVLAFVMILTFVMTYITSAYALLII